jgi:hypothetical protein
VISVTMTTVRPGALSAMLPVLDQSKRAAIFRMIGYAIHLDARESARAQHAKARHPTPGATGCWASIANGVNVQKLPDGVLVGSSHEASAQKEFGGKISAPGRGPKASGAKALTIPISPLSRGKTVRQMRREGFVIFRLGKLDTQGAGTLAATVNGKMEPLFLLRKSVNQKPQPWWPNESRVFTHIEAVLGKA